MSALELEPVDTSTDNGPDDMWHIVLLEEDPKALCGHICEGPEQLGATVDSVDCVVCAEIARARDIELL